MREAWGTAWVGCPVGQNVAIRRNQIRLENPAWKDDWWTLLVEESSMINVCCCEPTLLYSAPCLSTLWVRSQFTVQCWPSCLLLSLLLSFPQRCFSESVQPFHLKRLLHFHSERGVRPRASYDSCRISNQLSRMVVSLLLIELQPFSFETFSPTVHSDGKTVWNLHRLFMPRFESALCKIRGKLTIIASALWPFS